MPRIELSDAVAAWVERIGKFAIWLSGPIAMGAAVAIWASLSNLPLVTIFVYFVVITTAVGLVGFQAASVVKQRRSKSGDQEEEYTRLREKDRIWEAEVRGQIADLKRYLQRRKVTFRGSSLRDPESPYFDLVFVFHNCSLFSPAIKAQPAGHIKYSGSEPLKSFPAFSKNLVGALREPLPAITTLICNPTEIYIPELIYREFSPSLL